MRETIAIVDDSDIALDWAKSTLEAVGFQVHTHNRALGIQNFLRNVKPHVLLLDVKMPALQGDMVCNMLKKKEDIKDIKIYLYSSIEPGEFEKLCQQCGADGFIVKSDNPSLLQEAVSRAILQIKTG